MEIEIRRQEFSIIQAKALSSEVDEILMDELKTPTLKPKILESIESIRGRFSVDFVFNSDARFN